MKILEKGLVGLAPRRKAAGFTQESYAAALGISRSLVAMYEVGLAWPSAALLPSMADLLGCSIDELYERPSSPSAAGDGGAQELDAGSKREINDLVADSAGVSRGVLAAAPDAPLPITTDRASILTREEAGGHG